MCILNSQGRKGFNFISFFPVKMLVTELLHCQGGFTSAEVLKVKPIHKDSFLRTEALGSALQMYHRKKFQGS